MNFLELYGEHDTCAYCGSAWICRKCFALVPDSYTDDHTKWHDKQES